MKDLWPITARPMIDAPAPGDIVTIRRRGDVSRLRVRIVRSAERTARRFLVGDDRRGRCRLAWLDDVLSVERRRP